MPHPSHFHHAVELLQAILAGTLPADSQMDRHFRAHREMGVRDRGFVAETVYGCLREKRVLEHLCGSDACAPADLVAAYLVAQGYSLLNRAGTWRPAAQTTRGFLELSVEEPLKAAAHVVAGYHAEQPLDEEEIDVLWPLVLARLGVSVSISARRDAD